MTDTEILDYIEQYITPANTGGLATASVKLSSKTVRFKAQNEKRFRFGTGCWRPTLREAIADYARRYQR
jgi:hypothetical protein